jgi:hypothetical protein
MAWYMVWYRQAWHGLEWRATILSLRIRQPAAGSSAPPAHTSGHVVQHGGGTSVAKQAAVVDGVEGL